MKNVLGYLANIILVAGLMFFAPALVGLIYLEYFSVINFVGLAVTFTTSGFLLRKRLPLQEVTLLEAMVTSALAWLVVSGIGAIPYTTIAGMPYLDAYFEAMSGFTTTGMTLIRDVEVMPYSLLFWRSFTQWIGGVGIVVLFILFVTPTGLGVGVWRLYTAEAREERLAASTKASVKRIWQIYIIYTVACALLLMLVGINPFEAVNHSLAALATGGFSTRNLSVEAFNNPAAEAILTLFMFLGAINFLVHLRVFNRGPYEFVKSSEVRGSLFIVAASSALISLDLVTHGLANVIEALRISIFQTVSTMTTTGYASVDIMIFPPLSKMILLILMTVGGGVGSTAGAIKVIRVIILAKLVYYLLTKMTLPPSTIKPMMMGGHPLHEEEALRVAGFFAAYILLIIGGVLILTTYGLDPFASSSAVFSALGNVGPAFLPLYELPVIPKITLIFEMWAGRLEIIPILLLLMPRSWGKLLERS